MIAIRQEIYKIVDALQPLDATEAEHCAFVKLWIESGKPLFRTEPPDIPDPHLVSYFLLIDDMANKMLLTDHKKAQLWLPPGGHVELNEHPLMMLTEDHCSSLLWKYAQAKAAAV